MTTVIRINRAPVLTLWASVVAERLGFDREEALTLGKAVAGLTAYFKGRSLGLFEPTPESVKRERESARNTPLTLPPVALLGRAVPVTMTTEGIRAVVKDKPVTPQSVEKYLKSKFGEVELERTTAAMKALAESREPLALAAEAFRLYEKFRPAIPEGAAGWGAEGELDLHKIVKL